MNKKDEKIGLIIEIMKENDIAIGDILTGIKKQELLEIIKKDDEKKAPLDLLCKIGGYYRRISFEVGKRYEVLGLFPSLSNEYILVEQGNCRTRHVNETRIAPIELFAKTFKSLDKINKIMLQLHQKEIEGFYFVNKNDKCIKCNNPVIYISSDTESFSVISASADFSAKVIYFGIFDPLRNLSL